MPTKGGLRRLDRKKLREYGFIPLSGIVKKPGLYKARDFKIVNGQNVPIVSRRHKRSALSGRATRQRGTRSGGAFKHGMRKREHKIM